MCGITGIFHPGRPAAALGERLAPMTEALRHRGPDDVGQHLAEGIGLGFRRLSIVDLSGGNQPMYSDDGGVVSVCNGEIYNHRELRAELEARGHRFRSHADTEVLPALYREYGADFAGRLNGQFAFALYDIAERRLLLGRDPVGIAPLFYTEAAGGLLFASEIKALLSHPEVARRVDLTGLDQILTFPGPVSPRTLFAGVHSLGPGRLLRIDADGHRREWSYWDLDYPRREEIDDGRPEEECLEELDAALRRSVAYRLQADVPVGAYLSGGLDSALIAAIAADLEPGAERHTFSITFDDPAIDESAHQRLMARRLASRHHETAVGQAQIGERLRAIVRHAETPLRESYNACSLILSAMVREQGLKVVLTGEGADELFGGYVGYRLDDHRGGADDGDLDAMLEAQLRGRLWGDSGLFYEKNYLESAEIRQALYAEPLAARFAEFDCLAHLLIDRDRLAGRHPFHQRSYLDFKLRMADHLLADHGDRVGFANSVEARYPFLDPGVIDCARRIPPRLMVRDGEEKYLLKRLARRYLPAEIFARRKFSFVAPSSATLLRQGLPLVEELLAAERIARQGYFNVETVEHLKRVYRDPAHQLNQTFEDDLLMVVITFGLLLDEFQLPNLGE
ncbi:asparagine synthase (glutamine-hydrolyzing) [Endothiovibrio diazotrophicus]